MAIRGRNADDGICRLKPGDRVSCWDDRYRLIGMGTFDSYFSSSILAGWTYVTMRTGYLRVFHRSCLALSLVQQVIDSLEEDHGWAD